MKNEEETLFGGTGIGQPRRQRCTYLRKKKTRKKVSKGVLNQGELKIVGKEVINIQGQLNISIKLLNALTVVGKDTIIETTNLRKI